MRFYFRRRNWTEEILEQSTLIGRKVSSIIFFITLFAKEREKGKYFYEETFES